MLLNEMTWGQIIDQICDPLGANHNNEMTWGQTRENISGPLGAKHNKKPINKITPKG